jgi:hypothetical protein
VSVGADYETLDILDGKVPHDLHNAELSLVAVPGIPETSRVLQVLEAIGAADNVTVNKVLQITETVSLAEIVEVGTGGAKKTKLFLILGDLAVQIAGD